NGGALRFVDSSMAGYPTFGLSMSSGSGTFNLTSNQWIGTRPAGANPWQITVEGNSVINASAGQVRSIYLDGASSLTLVGNSDLHILNKIFLRGTSTLKIQMPLEVTWIECRDASSFISNKNLSASLFVSTTSGEITFTGEKTSITGLGLVKGIISCGAGVTISVLQISGSTGLARLTGHGTSIDKVLIFRLNAATEDDDVGLIIGIVAGIAIGIAVACTIAVLEKQQRRRRRGTSIK
ncbi:MAG: hypothetical protein Q6370_022655, partial [Candidatus Sigynarchaeota archaeon]